MTKTITGIALTALVCLGSACNPFEVIDPTQSSGYVATDELCIPDPDTGVCPKKNPDDVLFD